jgi:hypothetical protein
MRFIFVPFGEEKFKSRTIKGFNRFEFNSFLMVPKRFSETREGHLNAVSPDRPSGSLEMKSRMLTSISPNNVSGCLTGTPQVLNLYLPRILSPYPIK